MSHVYRRPTRGCQDPKCSFDLPCSVRCDAGSCGTEKRDGCKEFDQATAGQERVFPFAGDRTDNSERTERTGGPGVRSGAYPKPAMTGDFTVATDGGCPYVPSHQRPDLRTTTMATTTTPPETTPRKRVPTDPLRKAARVAGALYLLTFISIPTLALYGPVKEAGYIAGPGPDTGALVGGVLELIVALACIGTAVALYPVVKRQNEGFAMGFVGVRVLEGATIFAGVVTLLSIVTLRQAGAGAEALATGQALVAQYEWTTLFGQGTLPAFNALLLGTLLYKSRLVPRVLPLLGLIGAPLLIAGVAGTMFGVWEQVNVVSGIAVLLIAGWEFSLGVYLVVKGFRPSGLARLNTPAFIAGA